MVTENHLKYLQKIIKEINDENILGDIVECGVWKGGCCMWMMNCQKEYGMHRNFYLYDTFDGMTFPDSDKDDKKAVEIYNKINKGNYERDYDKWHTENKWAYAPIELVKNNINQTQYDESKIKYVIGDVCKTLDTDVPSQISILRLDTDWYNSTKKELDVLFPLVIENGYIIVDDYYDWKGSRTATDEFLKINKDKITIINTNITGGTFVFRKNKCTAKCLTSVLDVTSTNINESVFNNSIMPTLGFIILRHVNSAITNGYWIKSYKCIREFYPDNHILIIDDNSNSKFLTNEEIHNTTIINSEFPKRGELLPYYYYLHNKLFDTAVIIHDSVFIQKKMDFEVDKYKILWTFKHGSDQIADETKMIQLFNNTELYEFYKNKNKWLGCFGGMSIITHEYLTHINNKYDISKLLDVVLTRYNRCSFERVIACLLQKDHKLSSLLGDIHAYCKWSISIKDINKYKHLPLLKVWSGR